MTRTLAIASATLAVAMLTGCASQRISSALERYGVPPEQAGCVGDSLSQRLSFSQLRALDRAATSYRELDRGRASLTLFDLARVALELRDPVIPLEIVRAGVACSVLPAGSAPGRSR
jgi:hypothetical protein